MVVLGLAIFLALLATILSGLIKAYTDVSARELSRRSREGDEHAHSLHLVAKYGAEISLVFWPITLVFLSVSLVLFARELSGFVAIFVTISLLLIVFLYIPRAKVTRPVVLLAEKFASRLARTLAFVEPAVKPVAHRLIRKKSVSTGIYTKEDLSELLNRQRLSEDNRIDPDTLDMVIHLTKAKGRPISSVYVPLESTKVVSVEESIGPILINELHQTKQIYFPVREPKKKNIIGTFYIGDLQARAEGGKVKEVVDSSLYYVGDQQGVEVLLDAFVKTKSHIYLVINEHQKILGVIDIESAIKKLLGRSYDEYFDQYDNPQEVANTSQTEEDKV